VVQKVLKNRPRIDGVKIENISGFFLNTVYNHQTCQRDSASPVLANQLILGQKVKGLGHRVTMCKNLLKAIEWPAWVMHMDNRKSWQKMAKVTACFLKIANCAFLFSIVMHSIECPTSSCVTAFFNCYFCILQLTNAGQIKQLLSASHVLDEKVVPNWDVPWTNLTIWSCCSLAWLSLTKSILFCMMIMCFSFMISIAAKCSDVCGCGHDSLPAAQIT